MQTIRIGSRESRLAVIQTESLTDYIRDCCPGLTPKLVTMRTTGDRILNQPLERIGGKGLFVKELDQALLERRTDLSVHSLKDMPMELPESLPILGYSVREDPRDVLVLPLGAGTIDFSRPVGCSSRRRMLQFSRLYPQARFAPIRGNVQTRLKKLDEGGYSATILAAAGLIRLGLEHRISRYFSPEEMIPAAGQGVVAVQGRFDMETSFLEGYFDETSRITSECERAFVRELNGGCTSPTAAYATAEGSRLTVTGLYYREETGSVHTGSLTGDTEHAAELGIKLARALREA